MPFIWAPVTPPPWYCLECKYDISVCNLVPSLPPAQCNGVPVTSPNLPPSFQQGLRCPRALHKIILPVQHQVKMPLNWVRTSFAFANFKFFKITKVAFDGWWCLGSRVTTMRWPDTVEQQATLVNSGLSGHRANAQREPQRRPTKQNQSKIK